MKTSIITYILITICFIGYAQTPPYSGTIFLDPDIITAANPSTIQSTTYTQQAMVTMYDRRTSNWVTVNAYLFNVVWDDGLTSIAQVNPEFGSIALATIEAEKYAFYIGQLPHNLRIDVDEIWIHKGTQPFGGGNNSILIHTGQSTLYENDGILEETLIHEACHTSMDLAHASAANWIAAQTQDGNFISTYARDNPTREDVAESFLPWLAARYRQNDITTAYYNTITQTIPNRLTYLDGIDFNLYPFEGESLNIDEYNTNVETLKIYPNPASKVINIILNDITRDDIKVYSFLGKDFTRFTSFKNNQLTISNLPNGFYLLKIRKLSKVIYKTE